MRALILVVSQFELSFSWSASAARISDPTGTDPAKAATLPCASSIDSASSEKANLRLLYSYSNP